MGNISMKLYREFGRVVKKETLLKDTSIFSSGSRFV